VFGFVQNDKFYVMLFLILIFSAITNATLLPSTSRTLQEVQLVRCLTNISLRYLAPGRALVISSPAKNPDVQQELTAEIQGNLSGMSLLLLMVILANRIKQIL
jgi:hypothetical protein